MLKSFDFDFFFQSSKTFLQENIESVEIFKNTFIQHKINSLFDRHVLKNLHLYYSVPAQSWKSITALHAPLFYTKVFLEYFTISPLSLSLSLCAKFCKIATADE
jgi:hypothetical protein